MGRSRVLGVVVVLGVVASLGLVPAGTASAAVPGDVVISEFMFDPVTGVDGDEFLELTNRTAAPVDLSGWSFGGITLVLPAGTTIGANARMVVGRTRSYAIDLWRDRCPCTPDRCPTAGRR